MERFYRQSRLAAAGFITVAALLLSAPTEAAVKKVWASAFHPTRQDSSCLSGTYLASASGPCQFFTSVKLPVGSKVQKIQYIYRSTATVNTKVFLETGFFAQGPGGSGEWIYATDNVNTGNAQRTVEGSDFEFGNHKLKNGELVHIWADINGPNAYILGVKIYYKP